MVCYNTRVKPVVISLRSILHSIIKMSATGDLAQSYT
jgi:hypothetical protein